MSMKFIDKANGSAVLQIGGGDRMTFNVDGGINDGAPAFSAHMSALQSLATTTFTKINMDTEAFDTAACYDPAAFRFTPKVAGYYLVTAELHFNSTSGGGQGLLAIYKNGAEVRRGTSVPLHSAVTTYNVVTALVYLNGTTDYIELFGYQTSGAALNVGGGSGSNGVHGYFQGLLVRAA